MNDETHPHLSRGYFATRNHVTMTAHPEQLVNTPSSANTSVEHSMLPGKALEEMTVAELRDRASGRGIAYRGLNKAELVKALRE